MQNFTFQNPVKIVFGKNTIAELAKLLPKNKKILFVYGGGSIKKNGVYAQVTNALKGFDYGEFSGIEANPDYTTCMKAVEKIKAGGFDFLLSVGGGSVLDACKFIAAASCFEGDEPWDIVAKHSPVKDALPIGAVMTLPATGSEMNGNSVISYREIGEKLAFASPLVYPQFSILDPQTTFTLPKRQTINGIVDAYIHVCEQYMTYPVNAAVQDRMAEAVFKVLIDEGPKVLEKPDDYDARANIMWAATNALNFSLSLGQPGDWATHRISYQLTVRYGLDHAQALSVLLAPLWRHQFERKKDKLAQYGERVFGLEGDVDTVANAAIDKTVEFFRQLGMKTKLSEYGLTRDDLKDIPDFFKERKLTYGEHNDIGHKEIAEIMLSADE